MKNTNTKYKNKVDSSVQTKSAFGFARKFFIDHICVGVIGFALFFLFTIFIDFFSSLFETESTVNIDLFTILIGVAGFLLAFGFSFLENFKK